MPSEIGKLTNLYILHLDNNNFRGCVPRELSSMCSDGTVEYCFIYYQACGRLWVCDEGETNEECAAA